VETGCRGGQGSHRAVAPSGRKERLIRRTNKFGGMGNMCES
jgi:hypothetical protein